MVFYAITCTKNEIQKNLELDYMLLKTTYWGDISFVACVKYWGLIGLVGNSSVEKMHLIISGARCVSFSLIIGCLIEQIIVIRSNWLIKS